MALLQAHLPFGDHDFYLCSPPSFMQAICDDLRAMNIADKRIHAEAFGPASIRRSRDAAAATPMRALATASVALAFTRSAMEARWNPGDASLLEIAEARGLAPAFGCRAGSAEPAAPASCAAR